MSLYDLRASYECIYDRYCMASGVEVCISWFQLLLKFLWEWSHRSFKVEMDHMSHVLCILTLQLWIIFIHIQKGHITNVYANIIIKVIHFIVHFALCVTTWHIIILLHKSCFCPMLSLPICLYIYLYVYRPTGSQNLVSYDGIHNSNRYCILSISYDIIMYQSLIIVHFFQI